MNKSRSYFVEKINRIKKLLALLIKREKEKTRAKEGISSYRPTKGYQGLF